MSDATQRGDDWYRRTPKNRRSKFLRRWVPVSEADRFLPAIENVVYYLGTKVAAGGLGWFDGWSDIDGVHYDKFRSGHELTLDLKATTVRWVETGKAHPVNVETLRQRLRRGVHLYVGYDMASASANASSKLVSCAFTNGDRSFKVELHEPSPTTTVWVVDGQEVAQRGLKRVTFAEDYAVEMTWDQLRVSMRRVFDEASKVCDCNEAVVCPRPAGFDVRDVLQGDTTTGDEVTEPDLSSGA